MFVNLISECSSYLKSYFSFQRVVLWSDLHTARVSLADAVEAERPDFTIDPHGTGLSR